MENNSIIDDHGKYIAQRDQIKDFRFDTDDFERRWDKMRSEFGYFCKIEQFDLTGINIDERILSSLETLDEKIVSGDELDRDDNSDIFDFAWKKFIVFASQKKKDSYDFIASISACNIMKQHYLLCQHYSRDFVPTMQHVRRFHQFLGIYDRKLAHSSQLLVPSPPVVDKTQCVRVYPYREAQIPLANPSKRLDL